MDYRQMELKYIEISKQNDKLIYENNELKRLAHRYINCFELKNYINYSYDLKQELKSIEDKIDEAKDVLKKIIFEIKEKSEEEKDKPNIIKEDKTKKKKGYNKILASKEYKEFRKSILKRDNYKCQMCGSDFRLQVHHIKSKSKYPELIMDKNNCITLCLICHSKTDNFFKT